MGRVRTGDMDRIKEILAVMDANDVHMIKIGDIEIVKNRKFPEIPEMPLPPSMSVDDEAPPEPDVGYNLGTERRGMFSG